MSMKKVKIYQLYFDFYDNIDFSMENRKKLRKNKRLAYIEVIERQMLPGDSSSKTSRS